MSQPVEIKVPVADSYVLLSEAQPEADVYVGGDMDRSYFSSFTPSASGTTITSKLVTGRHVVSDRSLAFYETSFSLDSHFNLGPDGLPLNPIEWLSFFGASNFPAAVDINAANCEFALGTHADGTLNAPVLIDQTGGQFAELLNFWGAGRSARRVTLEITGSTAPDNNRGIPIVDVAGDQIDLHPGYFVGSAGGNFPPLGLAAGENLQLRTGRCLRDDGNRWGFRVYEYYAKTNPNLRHRLDLAAPDTMSLAIPGADYAMSKWGFKSGRYDEGLSIGNGTVIEDPASRESHITAKHVDQCNLVGPDFSWQLKGRLLQELGFDIKLGTKSVGSDVVGASYPLTHTFGDFDGTCKLKLLNVQELTSDIVRASLTDQNLDYRWSVLAPNGCKAWINMPTVKYQPTITTVGGKQTQSLADFTGDLSDPDDVGTVIVQFFDKP